MHVLGQPEMLFTLGFRGFFLRVRVTAGEGLRFALVVAGVVLVVLGR